MSDPALPASTGTTTAPAASPPEPDWTDQVTDLVIDVVDRIHDSTTGPLISVARGVVYGVVAAIVGVAALIIVTLLAVRSLDLLPGRIWIPYLALGIVTTAAGLLLWSKRTHPSEA
jgi:hypothetical protein